MSRPAWFGVLPFLGRHSSTREETAPVQGLVIAGGGAKASFQIGALRYLYEREHIAPSVISATSAGSILGALIAQSRDPGEQLASLHRIEKIWLEMNQPSDMFTERPWFTAVKAHSDALDVLRQVEESQNSEPKPTSESGSGSEAGPTKSAGIWSRFNLWPRGQAGRDADARGHEAETPGADEKPAENEAQAGARELTRANTSTDELDGLSPQERTLALTMADEPGEPLEWSPNVFFQLASGLPHLGRAGADLTAAWRGMERNRSFFKPGPILRKLLSRDFFHSEAVTSSGMTLRCAFVGLNTGELRFMREDGRLVDRNDKPLGGQAFDISMGVLASCSIPGVFKPVQMDDDWYVDGGIRENVPVEKAVSDLGVTKPYVIVPTPSGLNLDRNAGSGDLVSILFRVTSIQSDESERDEVAYARSTGAVVIEPEVFVHDSMNFDAGTLRINRDYGWIRAAEAVAEASAAEQKINREIIVARLQSWQRERRMQPGSELEYDPELLEELSEIKSRLQALLQRANPALLPPGAELWWQQSEGGPDVGGADA